MTQKSISRGVLVQDNNIFNFCVFRVICKLNSGRILQKLERKFKNLRAYLPQFSSYIVFSGKYLYLSMKKIVALTNP